MIRISAYAKINLSLSVLSRREDGFHEIDSLIQTVDLDDEISVKRSGDSLTVKNSLRIAQEEDLAWRAARLVLDEKGVSCGMQISINKKIPTGAGLGGGSSDAAAVMWAVDLLTPPILSLESLMTMGAQLGSDVPLFLHGGLVRATGRGERITPIFPSRREHFLLVVPPVHCDTARVYQKMSSRIASSRGRQEDPQLGENDLYKAAIFLYPELTAYAKEIKELDAKYAGMSGSGSTFYAAFDDARLATRAQERMRQGFPRAQVYLARGTKTGFTAKGEE